MIFSRGRRGAESSSRSDGECAYKAMGTLTSYVGAIFVGRPLTKGSTGFCWINIILHVPKRLSCSASRGPALVFAPLLSSPKCRRSCFSESGQSFEHVHMALRRGAQGFQNPWAPRLSAMWTCVGSWSRMRSWPMAMAKIMVCVLCVNETTQNADSGTLNHVP